MTGLELAYIQFVNKQACRAIDAKRAGVAPEIKPVVITKQAKSLMEEFPRKPPRKGSFGENYVKMVRFGASGHRPECALELAEPPFEIRLQVIRERKPVPQWTIPASDCTPSAIDPRFAGFAPDEPQFFGAPFGPWKVYSNCYGPGGTHV